MTEKTIDLDIPLLLPGVTDERDACLDRLEAALQNQKGLQRAHVERDKTPIDLCLHYDPDLLSLADVKRLAERAGAQIANRYHHALIPIENMDCSDCVDGHRAQRGPHGRRAGGERQLRRAKDARGIRQAEDRSGRDREARALAGVRHSDRGAAQDRIRKTAN